ncbi:hypothetical protein [Massilia phyllosphaerae]|uniref:hypothetical protein n=1 Tax=Massilia phyllosphaerae TaxID=3106034 RepID=UPI002B1CD66B|nr:hypothetical protein [Massilia sp. SGZ-792]
MSLHHRTDADLAADVRMLVAELSKLCVELGKRGIEVNTLHYEGGAIKVGSIERITKEAL